MNFPLLSTRPSPTCSEDSSVSSTTSSPKRTRASCQDGPTCALLPSFFYFPPILAHFSHFPLFDRFALTRQVVLRSLRSSRSCSRL
jgi:hypothetical protein